MFLVVQLVGSLLILIAFIAAQTGRWVPSSRRYLALNLVGSLGLAVSAVVEAQWGFVLLEAVWSAVSLDGLRRSLASG
jgi:hypothetical protein